MVQKPDFGPRFSRSLFELLSGSWFFLPAFFWFIFEPWQAPGRPLAGPWQAHDNKKKCSKKQLRVRATTNFEGFFGRGIKIKENFHPIPTRSWTKSAQKSSCGCGQQQILKVFLGGELKSTRIFTQSQPVAWKKVLKNQLRVGETTKFEGFFGSRLRKNAKIRSFWRGCVRPFWRVPRYYAAFLWKTGVAFFWTHGAIFFFYKRKY